MMRRSRPWTDDDVKKLLTAVEAGVTGDMKPVFAGLAAITAQCVGCHAGYRLK